jgi:hypothetical protein
MKEEQEYNRMNCFTCLHIKKDRSIYGCVCTYLAGCPFYFIILLHSTNWCYLELYKQWFRNNNLKNKKIALGINLSDFIYHIIVMSKRPYPMFPINLSYLFFTKAYCSPPGVCLSVSWCS